jgi:uncharacterized protein
VRKRVWMCRLLMIAGVVLLATAPLGAQRGRGRMGGPGPEHRQDMMLIHYLIDHREEITRTVTELPDGVETVTESSNPEIAAGIREHVASMARRLAEGAPIHMRDPLFREIFARARDIRMHHEATERGIRVTETSTDPYVAKLIKAHAEVVTKFIRNGHSEMMRDHPLPPRAGSDK